MRKVSELFRVALEERGERFSRRSAAIRRFPLGTNFSDTRGGIKIARE